MRKLVEFITFVLIFEELGLHEDETEDVEKALNSKPQLSAQKNNT